MRIFFFRLFSLFFRCMTYNDDIIIRIMYRTNSWNVSELFNFSDSIKSVRTFLWKKNYFP